MIDIKKIWEKIVEEDAVVAADAGASAGAGEVVSGAASCDTDITAGKGISADDVLGNCDDHHNDGYLGAKCLHVPNNILGKGKMMKRVKEIPGTKRRKKKLTSFEKSMQIVAEDEKKLKTTENDIYDLITHSYGLDSEVLGYIYGAVKLQGSNTVFIKFQSSFKNKKMETYYIEAIFAEGKLQPSNNHKVMTQKEAVKEIKTKESLGQISSTDIQDIEIEK